MKSGTLSLPLSPAASYQTAPLEEYSAALRERAADLFRRVASRLGPGKAVAHKGSWSFIEQASEATAAKLIVFEAGKGKTNSIDPLPADGVYVLLRVPAGAPTRTLGIAPMHYERFAYFRLCAEQDLDEMAEFLAGCTLEE
jgi:hypothetical protein